jgi:hypothetical protein
MCLSTLRGSNASLTLATSGQPADGTEDGIGPGVVRTGTGDINLAAAGNIVFEEDFSGAAGSTPAAMPRRTPRRSPI